MRKIFSLPLSILAALIGTVAVTSLGATTPVSAQNSPVVFTYQDIDGKNIKKWSKPIGRGIVFAILRIPGASGPDNCRIWIGPKGPIEQTGVGWVTPSFSIILNDIEHYFPAAYPTENWKFINFPGSDCPAEFKVQLK